MSEDQKFKIFVRGEHYSIEVKQDNIQRMIAYQVSTDCNYLMTVYRNNDGIWCANGEVQVMDDSLVNDIGSAIEMQG